MQVFGENSINIIKLGNPFIKAEGARSGEMLRWIENYYVGSSIRKPEEMKKKIDSGFFAPGIYLLTLAGNPDNLMEFLPAASLKQEALRRLCPTVIGMALGKEEAIELTCRILEEVYDRTGSFRVEDYLKNR